MKRDGLARFGHLAVDVEPVGLVVRDNFADGTSNGVNQAGLLFERTVGLKEAVIAGMARGVLEYFDDAKAFVDGFE